MKRLAKTTLCGFLVAIPFIPCLAHSQTGKPVGVKKSLAEQCAPDLGRTTERIFANPGGRTWQEYTTVTQVAGLGSTNGELMIAFKTSSSGRRFVRTVEFGEDNVRYQANCYDRDGRLAWLHYEMRTAWGWGYEDKRTFGSGTKMSNSSTRFFDLKNNQEIKRPAQAGDVPDFTKPSVYKNFDTLPIAGALKQKANATQK